MFAKIQDDVVPSAPGYSPGWTLAGEELPWAGKADLQEMGLKGVKPYTALLRLQSFPISQMLGAVSGQEGRESWERSKQTISRQRGGTGNWENLDCFPAGNVQAPEWNHEWRTTEKSWGTTKTFCGQWCWNSTLSARCGRGRKVFTTFFTANSLVNNIMYHRTME